MDCPKRSAGAAAGLPDDPLVEILSRVPAKSLCRFKCVSKAWRDLIADPHNRKKLRQAMEGLFCSVWPFSTSFIDLTARSVPLDIDPCFSFLTELPEIRSLRLIDSCNGLVLLERHKDLCSHRLGYIVCNPTTKEWEAVPLPTSDPPTLLTYTYLAFDPTVSSHFHLVEFQVEDFRDFISLHAYSSETGTWSQNQVEEQEEEGQVERWHQVGFYPGDPNPRCPFVNGFLHLAVWSHQHQIKIVALDVQGKARRMITVPQVTDGRDSMCYLGESQGHLHYMTREILNAHEKKLKCKLSIWVLQDYDTQEWVLKDTVNSHEVFGENSCMEFEVANIHQDCNVIFFTLSSGRKLVAYDMGRKEMSVIATFENAKKLIETGRYVPYFSELPVLTDKH